MADLAELQGVCWRAPDSVSATDADLWEEQCGEEFNHSVHPVFVTVCGVVIRSMIALSRGVGADVGVELGTG